MNASKERFGYERASDGRQFPGIFRRFTIFHGSLTISPYLITSINLCKNLRTFEGQTDRLIRIGMGFCG
jgi:hypothetical protein